MREIIKSLLIFFFGNKLRVLKMRNGFFRGILLEINLKNQLSLIFGTPEIHLQNIINRYVNYGDVVFDIGSNIGYVSIAMSRIVGESGKVYSFEAIPSTAKRCKKNLELNNCNNVMLVNKALSDECLTTEFRIPDSGDTHSMASMVWHKNKSDVIIVEVDTITLDLDLQFKNLNPSFIKIDVEGSEGKVILGMQKLIAKNQPIIFVECSEFGRNIAWDVLKKTNKYNCFNARDNKEIFDIKDYRSNDFLWIPKGFKEKN